MKKYTTPNFEVTELLKTDIITTSPGTETSVQDETDGNWEIGINV